MRAHGLPVRGVRPVLGNYSAEEDHPGLSAVVVLDNALWQRRFGGDPSVVGEAAQIDRRARAGISVLSLEFRPSLDFGAVARLVSGATTDVANA
jgi:hypothetical protein